MEDDCEKSGKKMDFTRQHDLTIEELKQYPMFSHFTDEQAQEIIATVKQFTRIVYNFCRKRAETPLN